MRASIGALGRRFEGKETDDGGQLANLLLYARSTVMSDDLVMLVDQLDQHDHWPNNVIVEEVTDCVRGLCFISDLLRSDALTLYYPEGVWRDAYDRLQDELIAGIGLAPLPAFEEWMLAEVFTDPDLRSHASTYATVAMTEMSESLAFCSLVGRNAAPVLGSARALACYRELIKAAKPASKISLGDIHDVSHLYSFSRVDLSNLPGAAIADLRFDSKAFETWQTFLGESLAETRDYDEEGKRFDEALQTSLIRRGKEFETRLQRELGASSLAKAFTFDSSNAVGFIAGVTGSVLTETPVLTALLTASATLTLERVVALLKIQERRAAAAIVRRHYHAFSPRDKIVL
jgi:hypothetical protein